MRPSKDVREIVKWPRRLKLGCPLSVAQFGSGLYGNLRALKPLPWKLLEDEPPMNLAFTLSEFCDANCTFCCHRKTTPRNMMSDEVFRKAASEYHDMGGTRIWLNAMTGEPLLDPLFFEKTSYLRSLGGFESVTLTTNGIRMAKDHIVDSLIASGVTRILVSTAGFEKEAYERYMGVKRYDEFLSGLVKLLKRNIETGNHLDVQIEVRGVLDVLDTSDLNTKGLPLVKESKGKVTVNFLRLYTDWIGQVEEEGLPEHCGFSPRIRVSTSPCFLTFNLGVLAKGDLRLCNCNYGEKGRMDDLRIGNIMEGSLPEIWRSEFTKKVRRSTYGHDSNDMCRSCLIYSPLIRRFQ